MPQWLLGSTQDFANVVHPFYTQLVSPSSLSYELSSIGMINLLSHIIQHSPVPNPSIPISSVTFYNLGFGHPEVGCSRGAGTGPEPGRSSLSSNMLLSLLYL